MSDYEGSPLTYPPLGLPTGSVRALLTLTCVAVVIVDTARDQPMDLFWVEALLISMAHYFTSRRFVSLPPATIRKLEDDGILERESQPLFLPRGSIRALIILAFVGLGLYLYYNDPERLRKPNVITLLALRERLFHRGDRPRDRVVRDAPAFAAAVAGLGRCAGR